MSTEKKPEKKTDDPSLLDRRELVKKGVKAAYVAPALLAIVKATERPAYASVSDCAPYAVPI
jgi:hypothetical protein